VFKAVARDTGVVVALKCMSLESSGGVPPEMQKEIAFMKGCDHPNIIKFMGTYMKKDKLWIAMEFCGGGSVSSLAELTGSPLTEPEIASLCKETLQVLFSTARAPLMSRFVGTSVLA
jgi:serine/threonine protein kinase